MRIFNTLFAKRVSVEAAERRGLPRFRTRLRPGRLLDGDLAFLGDCAILDRSAAGARVRLFGSSVEDDAAVALLDENDLSVRRGRVIWRRESKAGIRLESGAAPVEPAMLRRLAGPYYAVRD